jgi:sugar phosphate isomerase/epimerase
VESTPSSAPSAVSAPSLSFGSWAFSFGPFEPAPWPFDRLCRYVADAGYDGVEINGFRPHPHHDDYDSDAACATLRELLDDCGLSISAYAPDFTAAPPAEAPLEVYLDELDRILRFCERMGIRLLRTDTVSAPDALPAAEYERRFDRLVQAWGAAAERCRASGVTLAWEFEPGFWLNRPTEVRALVEAVDDPAFGVLFDTCHAYTGAVVGARHHGEPEILEGGVPEYADLLVPRIVHLHLIDSDGTLHDDDTSAHVPFGAGAVDFAAVLQVVREQVGPLPWWTVDFCFCPTTERDGRAAVPFVRELADRYEADAL